MSRSGVAVASDCVTTFEELKLRKSSRYIIYKLNETKTQIIVDKASTETDYEAFLTDLPENDCRWAVYDFAYKLSEGEGERNKIVFISWSPDNAPVRSKMTYSSSKDALRRAFNGVGAEIQGTDYAEVSHEALLDKVTRK
ncbi:cofilin [Orbilia oligospora]|uniref:Cofilin n=1 Tax=Orbilia oligospora TaxID=2813651 RepID=A0A7C8J916_ORBOL|nr:cofilin [Orbilia oligospora]KAF3102889.1 cofilin [Orbilia oligospora]KAF3113061.1 cofilin [Orbilia oligospora]KAF3127020.1 cofilin [Orbilia oligospora]KAF3127953.1 cofilin [Orbilia oligospora]